MKTDEQIKLINSADLNHCYTNLFSSVKLPYMPIDLVLVTFALLFLFAKLGNSSTENQLEPES